MVYRLTYQWARRHWPGSRRSYRWWYKDMLRAFLSSRRGAENSTSFSVVCVTGDIFCRFSSKRSTKRAWRQKYARRPLSPEKREKIMPVLQASWSAITIIFWYTKSGDSNAWKWKLTLGILPVYYYFQPWLPLKCPSTIKISLIAPKHRLYEANSCKMWAYKIYW